MEIAILQATGRPPLESRANAVGLARSHYLDRDNRGVWSSPILTPVVSADRRRWIDGLKQRQVYWWRESHIPQRRQLEWLIGLDGVLLDN